MLNKLSLQQKIIALVIGIGLILITVFQQGIFSRSFEALKTEPKEENKTQTILENPKVVSTNPSPLNESTVLPSQTIEVTFNLPLINKDETRVSLDPKLEFNLKLSEDRKTLKVTPLKSFILGQGYTLFIKKETKFEGGKTLEDDLNFGFKTINYFGV